MILATFIHAKGGTLPTNTGAANVCTAASEGDVRTVKLLYEYGVNVETGDYDDRCVCVVRVCGVCLRYISAV